MTYTLTKLELQEGKDSLLGPGYSSRLPNIKLANYTVDPPEEKSIESLDEITEGWQVVTFSYRDFHRTSKIAEILTREPKKLTFRTQTSIYELTDNTNE